MIITVDMILQYGGIAYGAIATYFVATQQVNILRQQNELAHFKYQMQERLTKLDNGIDLRFDKTEQDLIMRNVDRDTRIAVLESKMDSSNKWVSKIYNCILFDDSLSIENDEN